LKAAATSCADSGDIAGVAGPQQMAVSTGSVFIDIDQCITVRY
jgi:hypothetical protein